MINEFDYSLSRLTSVSIVITEEERSRILDKALSLGFQSASQYALHLIAKADPDLKIRPAFIDIPNATNKNGQRRRLELTCKKCALDLVARHAAYNVKESTLYEKWRYEHFGRYVTDCVADLHDFKKYYKTNKLEEARKFMPEAFEQMVKELNENGLWNKNLTAHEIIEFYKNCEGQDEKQI